MSRLTRGGTAEPVSRDQILRHARGQGNILSPVQLTTSRIGNLTRLIHTLLYVMTIHTYIHTYCLCVFVYVLYFIATMSFAGYFLPVLFCMLSMLISDSRFDLVWFRLSCDHGWIRSGSVNVRKQQQQQQQHLDLLSIPR